MTNKVALTMRLIWMRSQIERWVAADAFKDAAWTAEAQRLLDEGTEEEVSY